jgi:hypothetical protein
MSEEHTNDAGSPDEWEPVELERRRPAGVTVSVRMPADLLRRIERHATDRSSTVSDVIRQAAEAFVSRPSYTPVFTVIATARATLHIASPYASIGDSTRGSKTTTIDSRATHA